MGKTVLITGASRGIGAATARVFAENGCNVAINCLENAERARELKAQLLSSGAQAEVFKADVADSAQAQALIDAVSARFSGIDVLVNNAGVAWQGLFQHMSDADYRRVLDANLGGVFNCTRAVLPRMIAKKSGCIVNVSSVLGICGASCEVIYSASKAAVIGLTRALAKEVGPSGIRVNCVAPGVIDTDMNACHDGRIIRELAESAALEKIGLPRQVADAVFYLAGESASFITGQTLRVDGGLII